MDLVTRTEMMPSNLIGVYRVPQGGLEARLYNFGRWSGVGACAAS